MVNIQVDVQHPIEFCKELQNGKYNVIAIAESSCLASVVRAHGGRGEGGGGVHIKVVWCMYMCTRDAFHNIVRH